MNPFPFNCNDEMRGHLQKVLDGEYALPFFALSGSPVILDIGANLGAFTYWALQHYPTSTIIAYEPEPLNFVQLRANLRECDAPAERYTLVNAAVYPSDDKELTLYRGWNSGMHSIKKQLADSTKEPESFTAKIVKPSELPNADVIKADTEGCEVQILSEYLKRDYKPTIISFEWHSVLDRIQLERLMSENNYILFSGHTFAYSLGTCNYARITPEQEQQLTVAA